MRRILVLGGYGMIGAAACRLLHSAGHHVTAMVRSREMASAVIPGIPVIERDIGRMKASEEWSGLIEGYDVIINAAGALQDGSRDHLEDIHHLSMAAMCEAADQVGTELIVQISAAGADDVASTAFMRTKAAGDAAIRRAATEWIVLKPSLVVAPEAYGGTALLRMLAAMPGRPMVALPNARIQVIGIEELAESILACVEGQVATGRDYDLTAEQEAPLREVVLSFRSWLGLPPAGILAVPRPIAELGAKVCDVAGWFGWRSPLRTTALKVLEDGIQADPGAWREATNRSFPGLKGILLRMPATRQERVFARTQLVFPTLVLTLALFWIASGLIGIAKYDDAAKLLPEVWPEAIRVWAVICGSAADLAIGAALLFRRLTIKAALASCALAGFYLIAGTIFTPAVWLDPLGPFVKVLPAIGLGVAVAALGPER